LKARTEHGTTGHGNRVIEPPGKFCLRSKIHLMIALHNLTQN